MDNQQTSLWSKELIATFTINFLILLVYFMLLVTMTEYAITTFSATTSMAGLVAGMMVIGSLTGRFFVGYIINIVGIQKILITGTICFALSMPFYILASNLTQLLLVRFISGLATGLVTTATGTIVAYVVPPQRRGEGIGFFSLSNILATAIGPFVGITLLLNFHFNSLFLTSVFIGFIAFGMSILIKVDHRESQDSPKEKRSLHISDFISIQTLPIATSIFLIAIAYSGIQTYLVFYTKELNLESFSGLFFLTYAIVVFFSRPFTGRLLDKKSDKIIVYPALVLFAIGFLIISNISSVSALITSAIFVGLGFGNFQSTTQALSVKTVPINLISQATSTFFIFYDIGVGLGPYLLGLIIPYIGYNNLYISLAVFTLLNIPIYKLLMKKQQSLQF